MSSAAARAEARRKAILSRGGDRLSKLTSTARGDDNPVYSNVDVLSRKAPTTETFVGEESIMPTPPARASPAPLPSDLNNINAADASGSSAWTSEQQQEFMHVLMSAPERNGPDTGPSRPFGVGHAPLEQAAEAGDDPMAALLNALTQMTGQAPPGIGGPGSVDMNMLGKSPPAMKRIPPSLYSKLRPLLHLIASWILLAFFALFIEPKEYEAGPGSRAWAAWERWAELGWKSARKPFGVQPVPFFWAFVTLQLILHSIQIFTKSDPVQPPALLAMALPALPPQLRSLATNVLVYVRMTGMLLDDIAGLVVGMGILVWVSGWINIAGGQ